MKSCYNASEQFGSVELDAALKSGPPTEKVLEEK